MVELHLTPKVEVEVLQNLAREWKLDLDGWRDYQSNFKKPVCTWFGVVCDGQTQVVIGLELPRVNLSGSINAELGVLRNLRLLDLSENSLTGTIPDDIRLHKNLKTLNLAFNQLQGKVYQVEPILEVFNISRNEFSGPIVNEFGEYPGNLKILDVSHNQIGGVIPASIGRMGGLKLLDLGYNQIYGTIPSILGNLQDLELLFLNDNLLMGTIPKSLTREGLSLAQLFMEHNDLSGTVPADLANLRYLTDLYVDGNKFTGHVPPSICALRLNQNFVNKSEEGRDGCNSVACPVNNYSPDGDGVFPCTPCPPQGFTPYIGHDKSCYPRNEKKILDHFYEHTNGPTWRDSSGWGVDNVSVCGYLGVECNNSGHVVSLKLANNGLSGQITDDLGMLEHLQILDLSDNMLTGYIPSDLRFLPLQELNLANNKLHGYIPPLLCLVGDVNGNGINGHYDCDIIACPPGTWSPIGRASPDLEPKEGREIHECKPCHRHGSTFIGSRHCGVEALDRGSVNGVFPDHLPGGEANLIWTVVTLCTTIGILVVVIVSRTRKSREEANNRNRANRVRGLNNRNRDHGSDTESYFSEVTENQSVHLTKLDLDDTSMQTVDEDIGTGPMFSEVDNLDEENIELRRTERSGRAGDDERSQGSTESGGGRSRQNMEWWLDVPKVE